jgi:hypothetical protein
MFPFAPVWGDVSSTESWVPPWASRSSGRLLVDAQCQLVQSSSTDPATQLQKIQTRPWTSSSPASQASFARAVGYLFVLDRVPIQAQPCHNECRRGGMCCIFGCRLFRRIRIRSHTSSCDLCKCSSLRGVSECCDMLCSLYVTCRRDVCHRFWNYSTVKLRPRAAATLVKLQIV